MAISPTLTHYNNTIGLPGDISAVLRALAAKLEAAAASRNKKAWLEICAAKKAEWARLQAKTLCVRAAA